MLEFRLEIKSSGADGDCKGPQQWRITIKTCPVDGYVGESICVTPAFTMDDLKDLRDRQGRQTDLDKLRLYGDKVGRSIYGAPESPDTVRDALVSTFDKARDQKRGVRFVVELKPDVIVDGIISPTELPIELIKIPRIKRLPEFPASEFEVTVSRALDSPGADIQKVVYPIRMLVVAAAPTHEKVTNAEESKKAIKAALENVAFRGGQPLKNGPVEVVFCEPPTLAKFQELLEDTTKPWHIIHFVGHGGFSPDRDTPKDPTPQAHLLFERSDKFRDFVGARDFAAAFANHPELRLVVLTACSTAAPTPDQIGRRVFPASAFEGVAQYLMRAGKVTAVVAMQFDFEVSAASVFSQAFYDSLLSKQQDIDMAVAQARYALSKKFRLNNGVWITPALYSRSADGRIFEFRKRLGLGGSIIDSQTEEPLPGVKLTLPELKDLDGQTPTAFTGDTGEFQFDNLPPLEENETRLVAQKDGYKVKITFPTIGNLSQRFKMEPLPQQKQ